MNTTKLGGVPTGTSLTCISIMFDYKAQFIKKRSFLSYILTRNINIMFTSSNSCKNFGIMHLLNQQWGREHILPSANKFCLKTNCNKHKSSPISSITSNRYINNLLEQLPASSKQIQHLMLDIYIYCVAHHSQTNV